MDSNHKSSASQKAQSKKFGADRNTVSGGIKASAPSPFQEHPVITILNQYAREAS